MQSWINNPPPQGGLLFGLFWFEEAGGKGFFWFEEAGGKDKQGEKTIH